MHTECNDLCNIGDWVECKRIVWQGSGVP
uniref:Uncharacterized protein n=1 Tax=Arundo donax TaxID=35708 RepID=A0A0A9ANR4_ARUDO